MRKLLLLLCTVGFVCIGFSQRNFYRFKHYTTTDGLSQNTIIAIAQDSLGQMWIGTRDGLNKFDGNTFTTYRHEKEDSISISNNDILCLENSYKGALWVGTYFGVNRYNPKNNKFKAYTSKNTGLRNNIIWTINELSNKKLLVGTPSGIYGYAEDSDTFNIIEEGYQVFSILETKEGEVYLGTNEGLKRCFPKNNGGYSSETINGTENLIVQDIVEAPNGTLLFGTKKQSVKVYNKQSNSVYALFNEEELEGTNKNVRQLLYDNVGNLWLGTYNGIYIIDSNKQFTALHNNINDRESISGNYIKTLFKDKKGSIWIGTYYSGISLWDQSNVNFLKIIQKPGRDGLKFKAVSSIKRYKRNLFFGTEGGGVSILNTQTSSYKYLHRKQNSHLKSDNIKSLYFTPDQRLWVGTFDAGIALYNYKTDTFENSKLPQQLLDFTDNTGVYTIERNKEGYMLLGTIGKGVVKCRFGEQEIQVMDSRSVGLSNNIVRDILVDSKNNLWVSTLKGLNLIRENEAIEYFFYNENQNTGVSMTTVFEDTNGIIWAGTDMEGFYKLRENKFVPVKLQANGRAVTGIRGIEEDEEGNFWISTSNQGIIHYSPKEQKVLKNYTQKDGLVGNEFNNNSSLKVSSTHYFFGGKSGAVYFNADNIIKNEYAPQVIITDFKIKNKLVAVGDDTGVLNSTITYKKEIELTYDQGNFSVSFSMPNFINPSKNRYLYRLKGVEEEWVETSGNSASYTIQNPGNYTFEVKGINNDGVINQQPTVLNIRVNPAPWRTWWAFTLYGIFIFSALYYLLDILKSRTKLKHQLALEQMQVAQAEETNKAKLEFFTNISHEFRTPLTLILGPLHQILENYRGTSSMYKKLKVVESSANHLLQLINRLMDFRKLENNLMKLESAEGNIVKFLKEIYLSFTEYAKDGDYDYTFQTPSDQILVYYDRYKLERVFYNLISNAFRYTPKGGKIVLRIIEEDEHICIEVEDSGVGIAPEYRDKIFERFFELSINRKPDNSYNKGTGIGLSIVKNIVELHKGEITVKDNALKDSGSVFSVKLLLGRDHLEEDEILEDFKFSDDISQYVTQLEDSQLLPEEDYGLEETSKNEKPNVLLVEDNKQLRKFMKGLLRNSYNIFEAANGKLGYETAVKEPIDLIVSDVIMPEMNGTELCTLIKEDIRTSHIPVILLTSRSALIYKLEGLQSGADDYISKPFNVKEFQLRIKNIISSVSRLKQNINAHEILQPEDIVLSSLDEKLYKKALQIVEKNIGNEQFDIPYFCEELGVSRTVLFKKIKAWTDYTPNEFIRNIRLKRGAQLLEQGKINISQISYKVGFKNPKYFSKCFREKYGKTPSEYAKTFIDF